MAAELAGVLAHIATIDELDLDGVAADLARRRRRERAARGRADPVAGARARALPGAVGRRRRLRRPEPAGMSELLELTAAQCSRAIAAGDLDAGELFEAYRARAAQDDAERVRVGRRRAPPEGTGRRAARGQGPLLRRRASRARPGRGSSRATCRRTRRRSWRGSRPRARRCWARPTRTSSRWAPRRRTRRSGRRSTRGTAAASRAAPRAAAPPRSPRASRRGRSAPTPAARSASRRRCAASSACGRPTARSRASG